jgi:Methyltransferase domain
LAGTELAVNALRSPVTRRLAEKVVAVLEGNSDLPDGNIRHLRHAAALVVDGQATAEVLRQAGLQLWPLDDFGVRSAPVITIAQPLSLLLGASEPCAVISAVATAPKARSVADAPLLVRPTPTPPNMQSGALASPKIESTQCQPAARNIFACLVHESRECVVDLVRNLQYLDPSSTVLLFNGSKDPQMLDGWFPFSCYGAVVHPKPRPMTWGRLHDFALDCMRFALENFNFDTLTIVDSDQLGLRPQYSIRIGQFLAANPGVGLLSSSPARLTASTQVAPAKVAFQEIDLWRPLLQRFKGGEEKFVHWTFWPSTVFTAEAARALTRFFDDEEELKEILSRSRIWATEEVILPTIVALLGFKVAANPCSYDLVKHRASYSPAQIDVAAARPDVFWAHPVSRRYDDILRKKVRTKFNHYHKGVHGNNGGRVVETQILPVFLPTAPILDRMHRTEGWLEESEANLLIGATERALADLSASRAIVEVGSYCGRATVVLASVVKALRRDTKIWSIDPHDGKVGTVDQVFNVEPSFEKLRRNLVTAGVADVVEVLRARGPDVPWRESICLLLIDGLHDYVSAALDFFHFEPWLSVGGYVGFHDYADYFPGVVTLVDELLEARRFGNVCKAGSMIILQKQEAVKTKPST